MDLKSFTKQALTDILSAVEEVRNESDRDLRIVDSASNRSVEFDVAVTVEKQTTTDVEGGIKVMSFAQASGKVSQTDMNATVSRIRFGVSVDFRTKKEEWEYKNIIRSGIA